MCSISFQYCPISLTETAFFMTLDVTKTQLPVLLIYNTRLLQEQTISGRVVGVTVIYFLKQKHVYVRSTKVNLPPRAT